MVAIKELVGSPEFERLPIEAEQTFIPLFPDTLMDLREQASTIKQVYLSGMDEPCELRMREITEPGGTIRYEAGIKGNERLEGGSRVRDELVDGVEITKELFELYTSGADLPTEYKFRTNINKHTVVDFTEYGISIETESEAARQDFFNRFGGQDNYLDVTGEKTYGSRWRAERHYRQEHGGSPAFEQFKNPDTDAMVAQILSARLNAVQPLIITLSGRSGSGKTTVVRELRDKLAGLGLTSDVTSTDNYHLGKTKLEALNGGQPWERWDDEIVYNLRALTEDLSYYQQGEPIAKPYMNFITGEPEINGVIKQVDVLIVEGIYAGAPELRPLTSLNIEIPTPFATCVWRRLLRDARERPEFGDYTKNFLYMLYQGEPAYRQQIAKRLAFEQMQSS